MTGTRQHEESTTLRVQPCRTAAVVGYIMASPRYAAASCFRRSLHLSLHHTAYFCCAAAAWVCSSSQLIVRVNLDGNTGTFGIAIRYKPIFTFTSTGASFSCTSIFRVDFLPTSQMMTRHQTTCAKHAAVYATLPPSSSQQHAGGPFARAVSSPYCGEFLLSYLACRVLSYCSLVLN